MSFTGSYTEAEPKVSIGYASNPRSLTYIGNQELFEPIFEMAYVDVVPGLSVFRDLLLEYDL